jgi:hypothetical protein
MTNALKDHWRNLSAHGERLGRSELSYYPLPETYIEKNLLIAVDGDRFRHLLIPVPEDQRAIGDQRSRGVRISVRDLEEDGSARRFIDVVCLFPELNDLFDDVLVDMIHAVSESRENPAVLCRNVLNRWRELIERGRPPKLGNEALVGLFGELLILKDLTRLSLSALDSWTGPSGARHDFVSGNAALEVKTSTRRNGRSCKINGHLQLVPPEDGTLNLAYFKVETTANGRSVPELIEEIFSAGVDRMQFRKHLQDANYDDSYSEEYAEFRWSILERRMYLVDESFPRIVPESFVNGDLPSGISDVIYTVELLAEPPNPLSDEADSKFLQKIAGTD